MAAPTRVGNYLCGTPFFLIFMGLASIGTKHYSETSINVISSIYLVPGTICGAIFGTVFIPFSYICPENPWYENFSTYHREWSCSKPNAGPYVSKNKGKLNEEPGKGKNQ